MRLIFSGKSPQYKYFRIGVVGNNLADNLVMFIEKQQETVNLLNFTPTMRIVSYNLRYYEETKEFEINTENYDKYIVISYTFPDKITKQEQVNIQLIFENENGVKWQTEIFNITFDKRISVGNIAQQLPSIADEIEDVIALTKKHIIDTTNPHKTTFQQVGAAPFRLSVLPSTGYRENAYVFVNDGDDGYRMSLKDIKALNTKILVVDNNIPIADNKITTGDFVVELENERRIKNG